MSAELDEDGRNMYGCTPCPKCGETYRTPTQHVHPTKPDRVLCDDCGFEEPIDAATRQYLAGPS